MLLFYTQPTHSMIRPCTIDSKMALVWRVVRDWEVNMDDALKRVRNIWFSCACGLFTYALALQRLEDGT